MARSRSGIRPRARARRYYQGLRPSAVPELKAIIVAFAKWRPMVRAVAKSQRQFQSTMPETFRRLRNTAMRADRTLIVHQQVRDFIAEGSFEHRYGKTPNDPIFTMHERSFHQLHGCAFFEHTNVEVLFDLAVQDLEAAVSVGMNTEKFIANTNCECTGPSCVMHWNASSELVRHCAGYNSSSSQITLFALLNGLKSLQLVKSARSATTC